MGDACCKIPLLQPACYLIPKSPWGHKQVLWDIFTNFRNLRIHSGTRAGLNLDFLAQRWKSRVRAYVFICKFVDLRPSRLLWPHLTGSLGGTERNRRTSVCDKSSEEGRGSGGWRHRVHSDGKASASTRVPPPLPHSTTLLLPNRRECYSNTDLGVVRCC